MSTSTCECGDHVHGKLLHWHVVLVSPEDAGILATHRCSAHPIDRPARVMVYRKTATPRYRRLHALIMGTRAGLVVDHVNRNPLDNRRRNLRWATPGQNVRNRVLPVGFTGFRGVHLGDKIGTYKAFITVNGRRKCLGVFKDKYQAAAAYDEAAKRVHGEFAVTNSDLKSSACQRSTS